MECTLCLCIEEFIFRNDQEDQQYCFSVCKKYLTTVEIIGIHFKLCHLCVPSVEKLIRIHKKLEKIENRMRKFSIEFSATLLDRRSKKNVTGSGWANILEEKEGRSNFKTEPSEDDSLILDDIFFPFDEAESIPEVSESCYEADYYGIDESNASNSEESVGAANRSNTKDPEVGNIGVDIKSSTPEIGKTHSILPTRRSLRVEQNLKSKTELNNSINKSHEDESESDLKTHDSDIIVHKSRSNLLKCKTCKRTFKEERYLRSHEKVHSEERKFVCEICNKEFKWNRNLSTHKKTAHATHPTTETEKLRSLPNGEKAFACEKCEKSFASAYYLRCHEKVHSSEKSYACEICEKTFRWRKNLVDHQKHIHSFPSAKSAEDNPKYYSCEVCGITDISNKKALERHNRTIHPEERPFLCITCGKSFTTDYSLLCHEKVHTTEKTHICPICSKVFRWKKNLVSHQKIHSAVDDTSQDIKPNTSTSCSLCGISVNSVLELENHVKQRHPGVTLFACHLCGKNFKEKHLFDAHQSLHLFEKRYICSLCGKAFNWRKNLVAHRKTVHGIDKLRQEDEVFVTSKTLNSDTIFSQSCKECGKTLSSKSAYTDHMTLHTGEKPYQCDYDNCNLKFRTIVILKTHKIKAHCTEYPFRCDQCDSRFQFKSQLTRHITDYHPTIDKLHICELCGKSFKRGYRLKDHMRSHSEEDKFKCLKCDRKFSFKCSLNNHVKLVHTGELSFICDICGKNLSSKTNLDDHIRTHTKEQPYECTECYQPFSSTTKLSKHRKATGHELD